jgi:GT2 family glycosyltransferase
MTIPEISIIIVNYNGIKFLEDCIVSLKNAFKNYTAEIIIIDNASTDGSYEWLEKRNDILFVPSEKNLGFTRGNNLAAEHARGRVLLFINNDTVVNTPMDYLIDQLADETIGMIGCQLVYGDQRQQFSMGYEHTPIRIVLSWLGFEKKHQLPKLFRRVETNPAEYLNDHNNVDWISGACFAIRQSVWKAVGGFDTRFFMYCEDVDLAARVRQLGLRVCYTPKCTVTHYEGAGRVWIGTTALLRTVNSYHLYTTKYYGKMGAIFTSLMLSGVFFARATGYFLQAIFNTEKSKVQHDKSSGYAQAGTKLLKNIFVFEHYK